MGDGEWLHALYLVDPKALANRPELRTQPLSHNMNTEMTLSGDMLPTAHNTAMEADCRTRGAGAARGTSDSSRNPTAHAHVESDLSGRMLMPPRPPQRAGVVVQLTDELLELYSLDISQPAVRQTSTHQVGCTMGYAKNASGSRLFPSYRRAVSGRSI